MYYVFLLILCVLLPYCIQVYVCNVILSAYVLLSSILRLFNYHYLHDVTIKTNYISKQASVLCFSYVLTASFICNIYVIDTVIKLHEIIIQFNPQKCRKTVLYSFLFILGEMIKFGVKIILAIK